MQPNNFSPILMPNDSIDFHIIKKKLEENFEAFGFVPFLTPSLLNIFNSVFGHEFK